VPLSVPFHVQKDLMACEKGQKMTAALIEKCKKKKYLRKL